MNQVPSAIIFVNNDLTDNTRNALVSQLFIDEVISGDVFDARVAADGYDGYYVRSIKSNNLRLMVVRSFREQTNRELADVVIFVKAALASVLKNNYGPPGTTHSVVSLYWGALNKF
jgi:hypothetical protein